MELAVEAEEVDVRDPRRSAEVRRVRASATWPVGDGLRLRAGVGLARIEAGTDSEHVIGYLGADGALGRLRYSVDVERDVFDETAQIVSNQIRRTEADLLASFRISDRWRFDGNLELYDFSDDNDGWRLELTPQYALRAGNPSVRVGYRRIHSAFARQSGGGYFDPDHLRGDQLVVLAAMNGERLRGDMELFVGQQVTRRFGQRQRDEVLGGSARLAYDFNPHVSLEAEVEGGNFSLLSAGGFEYFLWSVSLVAFF